MACDTFLKISNKCKRKFVVQQLGEAAPFLSELLDALPATIQDLQPHQVHAFYEAAGLMVGAEGEEFVAVGTCCCVLLCCVVLCVVVFVVVCVVVVCLCCVL